MEQLIKYIELKSGYSDNGPAWIGKVELSKSGKTVYFNGHAFKGNGHGGCTDIETRETYWISGIKKNGEDRHWAGNGKIKIDREIVDEYLRLIDSETLDMRKFEIVDIIKTDKQRFVDIENERIDTINVQNKYDDLSELSLDELRVAIESLRRRESYTNSNNGRKFITIKKLEAEQLLAKLKSDS